MYDLYVITDENLSNGLSHSELTKLACEGGADVIQLRDKSMGKEEMMKAAKEMRRITSLHNVFFFVNDHFDVAVASEADGIHLGQSDMKVADAVKQKGNMLVGISVGSLEEAIAAEKGGADYIGFGPVFDTGSKHDAGKAVGLEVLKKIRDSVNIPIVAIGGVTKDNTKEIITSGADGVAVISAVVSQNDVKKATEELKKIVSSAKIRV
jgi:thiamine-phosphate pyrophosphorylase